MKLHSKICTHCWNINKSWRDCIFWLALYVSENITCTYLPSQ